jgi:NAD/NADP transhydrogenase alpha subunit
MRRGLVCGVAAVALALGLGGCVTSSSSSEDSAAQMNTALGPESLAQDTQNEAPQGEGYTDAEWAVLMERLKSAGNVFLQE